MEVTNEIITIKKINCFVEYFFGICFRINIDSIKCLIECRKQKYITNEIIGGNNIKLTIPTKSSALLIKLLFLLKIMYVNDKTEIIFYYSV